MTTSCDTCNGLYFVLSNNEAGYRDLQRCDECDFFASDDAAKAYVKTYMENTEKHHSFVDVRFLPKGE
jgi:hypothetical protein